MHCWSAGLALQGELHKAITTTTTAAAISIPVLLPPQLGVALDVGQVAAGVRGHGIEEVGELARGMAASSCKSLLQQELGSNRRVKQLIPKQIRLQQGHIQMWGRASTVFSMGSLELRSLLETH